VEAALQAAEAVVEAEAAGRKLSCNMQNGCRRSADRLYSAAMQCVRVLGLLVVAAIFTSAQARLDNSKANAVAEDEAAVRAIVNHWQQTWDKFDASVLQGDYAADADWLNAFGVRLKGGAKIVEFVSRVVKRPNVQDRHTTWEEPTVRFIRPDVALAFRDYTTTGHKTPDGREMPERKTHSTWVLTKDNGRWQIASHMIADDNAGAMPQPK
jgi:uncharacterized protein (TIGR02246 family)